MNTAKHEAMQEHLHAVHMGHSAPSDVYAQCGDGLWVREYCDYTATGHGHYWRPWRKLSGFEWEEYERVERENARYEWEQSHGLEFLYCVETGRL